MNMAENNLRFFNERLFARKGQAIPAALPAHTRASDICEGGEGTVAKGAKGAKGAKAAADCDPESRRSPLSFLIQRRCKPEDDRAAPTVTEDKPATAAYSRDVDAEMSVVLLDSVREKLKEFETARKHHEPRRKLTVRLTQDDFQNVKSLAESWGTTYQSLLEKGVRSYVLSVQGAKRACNGAKRGVKASAGPSRRSR